MTTKQKIYMTALELSEKKDVDSISVKDIITSCGISRQTFYYYYRDLEDLMDVVGEELCEKLLQKIHSGASLDACLKMFIELLVSRKKLYLRIINSSYWAKTVTGLQAAIGQWVMEYVKQNKKELRLSMQETQFLMDFYAGGIFNLIQNRLQKDDVDVDVLVQFIVDVMEGRTHF